MLEPFSFNYIFLFIEYILGALAIVFATILTLYRLKVNFVSVSLALFGFSIVLWDVLVFIHRTAATYEFSIQIFKVIGVVHPFILGFFFLTFLNIWRTRLLNLLCLAPSVFGSIIYTFFVEYEMVEGAFGWSYHTIIAPHATFVIIFFTPIYMASILFVLIFLWLKAASKSLRKSLLYILVSFIIFQAIGVTVTNFILLQVNPNFPPLGGFFYLATFLVIYHVLNIPSKDIITLVPLGYSKMAEDFSKLLKAFIESMSSFPEQLGIRYFRILSYLNERGLGDVLSFDSKDSRILLNIRGDIEVDTVNKFIDLTLTLLESGELDKSFGSFLVEFINKNYSVLGAALVQVLKRHENYVRSERLFEMFSKDLKQMFLPKGFSLNDFEVFSKNIGITHDVFKISNFLLEFSSEDYLPRVLDFVKECLCNGENVYVFTRKGSVLENALNMFENLKFVFLSTTHSKVVQLNERISFVPAGDISSILGFFNTITRVGGCIVFDNISDIIILTSFEQAYKMIRHALDILSTGGSHCLFLINKNVHGNSILSAFESLFKYVLR
ncbi:MAG: hypothetical protein N3F64_02235 [Nitrososphaeria archaeon]|nr:hypothetical protein [Nitrososphaeria archaeon]